MGLATVREEVEDIDATGSAMVIFVIIVTTLMIIKRERCMPLSPPFIPVSILPVAPVT